MTMDTEALQKITKQVLSHGHALRICMENTRLWDKTLPSTQRKEHRGNCQAENPSSELIGEQSTQTCSSQRYWLHLGKGSSSSLGYRASGFGHPLMGTSLYRQVHAAIYLQGISQGTSITSGTFLKSL